MNALLGDIVERRNVSKRRKDSFAAVVKDVIEEVDVDKKQYRQKAAGSDEGGFIQWQE